MSSPASGFTMGNATEFFFEAEKPFGFGGFYLLLAGNYFKSQSQINYDFTSSTAHYVAPNINASLNDYRVDLGIRLKLFDGYNVRPYIEGGGIGGFVQIVYDSSLQTPAILAAGTNYATTDSFLEFGYFAGGGFEFQLEPNWGVRASYKYINSTTRNASTVGNQNINYTGSFIGGSLFWNL